MKTHLFFSRLCHSPIFRVAVVVLFALVWNSLAVGGEIHDAAKDGDLEKVKALLKLNPDLVFSKDTNSYTPLFLAAIFDHKDVAELLLANKADVNSKDKNGETPLHWAAINNHIGMVKFLLASNADVNIKDNNGITPLHLAAFGGYEDVVELLLANKADVNAKATGDKPVIVSGASRIYYSKGMTPLHLV